jgi:hypothetical protein
MKSEKRDSVENLSFLALFCQKIKILIEWETSHLPHLPYVASGKWVGQRCTRSLVFNFVQFNKWDIANSKTQD